MKNHSKNKPILERGTKLAKKHWSNILFGALVLVLIIPQTRTPIQVFVQRLIAFSPSATSVAERETLHNYHWSLQRLKTGEQQNLLQSKGHVTVINFWATWCPPCIAEMPSFQKLVNDYREKVDFYFVSREDPQTVSKFLNENNYNLPVYIQHYRAPKLLQANVFPTTYVISKSGKLVVQETGAADWNSKKTRRLFNRLLTE